VCVGRERGVVCGGLYCVNVFEYGYNVCLRELFSGQVLSPMQANNQCMPSSQCPGPCILTISQGGTWLGEMQRGKPAKSRLSRETYPHPPSLTRQCPTKGGGEV